MRAFWFTAVLLALLSSPAEAGFGLEAGGTMTLKGGPKIELNPREVGGGPLPPISVVAGERFVEEQADLLGTFGDFVNPTDALAAEALASGRRSFQVTGSDAKKVDVAFEVMSKAFGVRFHTTGADPGVVVMDDRKDHLPPVELYEGDRVTMFFLLDVAGSDGKMSVNRFGTEAVVVYDGGRAALVATTVVAALGAPEGGGFVWAVSAGEGVVTSTPGGVVDVSSFAELLARAAPVAKQEPYLFTFADVHPKGWVSPEFRSEREINGPSGSAVSLKELPSHGQIRVTATAHFIDDWQGETARFASGSGVLSAEARAGKEALDALLGSYAGLGVQTASSPPQVVIESADEAPFAAAADGTVLVLGAALALGRTPAIHMSTARVDILPDGRIYRSALVSPGSITILATKEGWVVVETSSKADGTVVFQTETHASADKAVGAVKAWFGQQGLSTDRVGVSGDGVAILQLRDRTYRTLLVLSRNASPEP